LGFMEKEHTPVCDTLLFCKGNWPRGTEEGVQDQVPAWGESRLGATSWLQLYAKLGDSMPVVALSVPVFSPLTCTHMPELWG
jgi:hypothetical protein